MDDGEEPVNVKMDDGEESENAGNSAESATNSGKETESNTRSDKGGRHKEYKLHFGWLHFSKGSYKQVKNKQGGGTRIFSYDISETQTVESLISLGKDLFFPAGRSQHGLLSDMEVSLSHFDGTEIPNFKTRNGKDCSFQDFLKCNGLYSSQFYLYIKTKEKESEQTTSISGNDEITVSISKSKSVVDPQCSYNSNLADMPEQESHIQGNETGILLMNKKVPQKIIVKYTRDTMSSYSGQICSLSCQFMHDCERLSEKPPQADYTPFEDGFAVTSISIGDNLFLDRDINGIYTFPQKERLDSAHLILHGPDEIFGTEDYSLIIGVITKEHNAGVVKFTWFKSGEVFAAGIDLCLVCIKEPGE